MANGMVCAVSKTNLLTHPFVNVPRSLLSIYGFFLKIRIVYFY